MDNNNNLVSSAERQLEKIDFSNISSQQDTWSGTYTKDSGYTFACQHNNTSGALNLKQNLLNTRAPKVVRDTFSSSINNHVQESNGQSTYSSLLTNQKMLVNIEGKDSIVELLGNGSVKEYTSKDTYNLYSIQINEGEPISWVMTKETISETSKMMNDDIKPTAEPTDEEILEIKETKPAEKKN